MLMLVLVLVLVLMLVLVLVLMLMLVLLEYLYSRRGALRRSLRPQCDTSSSRPILLACLPFLFHFIFLVAICRRCRRRRRASRSPVFARALDSHPARLESLRSFKTLALPTPSAPQHLT